MPHVTVQDSDPSTTATLVGAEGAGIKKGIKTRNGIQKCVVHEEKGIYPQIRLLHGIMNSTVVIRFAFKFTLLFKINSCLLFFIQYCRPV